ncbi:MAG TPA: phage holin family protein [Terriglobales bacterium]|nr:phage holin family protein [Terriglobales bacterium]
MRLLIRWLVSAVSLLIVAQVISGFVVHSFLAALLAAIVIGFVNATLGLLVKIMTFPLSLLTFGLFLVLINAMMLKVAAWLTPGFEVQTWKAAILGAILLSFVSWFLHWLVGDKKRERAY